MKKALVDLKTNPLFCNYIFYPVGVGMGLHTLTIFNGLISIPFQMLFNLATAYNLVVVFSFVLSAYGTFLLVDYLIKDKLAALIAGIIFSFCPYKFAHLLGHMNLVSTEWLPFYVLFLLKSTESGLFKLNSAQIENSDIQTKQGNDNAISKNSLLAGLFLMLVFLCDYYYFVYLILFTLMYFTYLLFKKNRILINKFLVKRLLFLLTPSALAAIPIIYSVSSYVFTGDYTLGEHNVFVSDLLGPIIPGLSHPLLGKYAQSIYSTLSSGVEGIVSPGLVVVFLSLYAAIKYVPKFRQMRFWMYTSLIFFILSLGSILHISGQEYAVPLPYSLFRYLPILKGMRCPSRMAIMEILSLAVLSAYTLHLMLQKNRFRYILGVIVLLLISFEYLSVPYPMINTAVPEVYKLIAQEKEDATILEIPISLNSGFTAYGAIDPYFQFWQTVHNKRLLNGIVSRGGGLEAGNVIDIPFISEIFSLQENIYSGKNKVNIKRVINLTKIKYIVIHQPSRYKEIQKYLKKHLILEKIFEDKEILAFKVNSIVPWGKLYNSDERELMYSLYYADGWFGEEKWGGEFAFRWSKGKESSILVKIDNPADYKMQFRVTPFPFGSEGQVIKIYINDKFAYEQHLNKSWNEYSFNTPLPLWKKGLNKINISYKNTISPRDCSDSLDNRKLAIAVNYFKLKKITKKEY